MESIRKIIVPTDFSALSETALRSAAALARQDGASVHLLHSIRLPFFQSDYDVNVPESVWEELRNQTREKMYESQLFLEEAGVEEVDLIVSERRQPADAIAEFSRELDADLVVMATHGRRGLKHAFLGSVTERTIRTAPIPVLAVRDNGLVETPIRRILLPTDFSTHAEEALSLSRSLATRYGAHLDVLHVLDRAPDYLKYGSAVAMEFDERGRAIALESLKEIDAKLEAQGLSVRTHLVQGTTADVIADEAERLGSELIVMGTHGFTGLTHAVIGSVTERTLRLAPCAVLTTKAAED